MNDPAFDAIPTGALCAEADPELFFPEKGGSTRQAKAMCGRCDLQPACLETGLTEQFGIWGGYSERERRKLCHDRGITVPTDQDLDHDLLAQPHTKEVA